MRSELEQLRRENAKLNLACTAHREQSERNHRTAEEARAEGRREMADWAVSAVCEYHADGAEVVVAKIRELVEDA